MAKDIKWRIYGKDCVTTVTVYYEGGLFLVMCHHAMYKHFHTHKYYCCTGTVNISSWYVCVCGGGGKGSLYSCIDWEPVILPQTSPTKDAWKSHTDVSIIISNITIYPAACMCVITGSQSMYPVNTTACFIHIHNIIHLV